MVAKSYISKAAYCVKKTSLYGSACLLAFLSTSFIDNQHLSAQTHVGSVIVHDHARELIKSNDESLLLQAGLQASFEKEDYAAVLLKDEEAVQSYYRNNGYDPIWTKDFSHVGQIKDVVELLEQSWTHGLNPEDYHLKDIRQEIAKAFDVMLPQERRVASRILLDLKVTDAIVRYVHDMTAMRIAPDVVGTDAKYWREPVSSVEVLARLAEGESPVDVMRSYHPKSALYRKLQDQLHILLGELQLRGAYDPSDRIDLGGNFLRMGYSHKAVEKVRDRLGLKQPDSFQQRTYFDHKMELAVRQFQDEHGLEVDGIVGGNTLKMLNRTTEDKIAQVFANLERMRWIHPERPERFLLVNIPSATLWAVDEGKVEFEMPVVVGKPSRKTKMFNTKVTGVRYNPTWTVPYSIKKLDILPALQKNASYTIDKGMELYRNGDTIDPTSIDWANISNSELREIRMVQAPGDNNALGRIRVLMPNRYNIYLHDTNHPEYFARDNRAQSSGCIRLSDPRRMAQFIMQDKEDWDEDRMDKILDEGAMRDISAESEMPVYIYYQTVWSGKNGELVFGHDVYGYDRKMAKELQRLNKVYLPKKSTVDLASNTY